MAVTKVGNGKKAGGEKTSTSISKIASKGLKAPSTLTTKEIKRLAGSALTQAPSKKK